MQRNDRNELLRLWEFLSVLCDTLAPLRYVFDSFKLKVRQSTVTQRTQCKAMIAMSCCVFAIVLNCREG
jgi:hypothetical protein